MTYYVYENWRAGRHKAVIHRSDCGNCKEGTGQSGYGTREDNGKWHGPFDTLEPAITAAKKTGGFVSCGKCCLKNRI
jgi:hypothetical protein